MLQVYCKATASLLLTVADCIILSLVRGCRLLLCHSALVRHLGSQHEAQGEDLGGLRSQPWCFVSPSATMQLVFQSILQGLLTIG